jgi:sensor histidine kinase YesM
MATTCPTRPPDLSDMHPLELIPWFRRYPPGLVRDLVYTAIWNTLIAVAFTIVGLLWVGNVPVPRYLWWNFVFAQCIGYAIHLLFALAGAIPGGVLRRGSVGARFVHYAAIPIAGVILGYVVAATLLGWMQFRVTILSPRGLVSLALLSLLLSGLLAAVLLPRERAARAEAEAAREQARAAAAEREAALARMKALEAQVEPHFLYNTLAHVTSLIDDDPRAARTMLDRLVGLLRATAGAGAAPSTLGAQADLVRDWLGILALRMGARLAWHVDVPPHLRDARVPPALLQPLVENAIKHGLEPKIEGGRVDVVARDDGADLVVAVTDTGAGFGRTALPLGGSTGLGLAGLRARLAALYDGRASVAVRETAEGGVRVTVRLPLERSP